MQQQIIRRWGVIAAAVWLVGASAFGATPAATTQPLSAADLGKALKQMQDAKAKQPRIAHIDLTQPITEKPASFSLFGGGSDTTHYSVLRRLRTAADDASISGVLVTLGDIELEMTQAHELRDALADIAAKSKPVVVYADGYTTPTYILATGATDICLLPGGEIMMPGVSIETMFAKGLLDKAGVQADFIQVGDYKGAAEAMTRTSASEQLAGEMNALADALYDQILKDVSARRHLPEKAVRKLVDQAIITADAAKEAKLVDHVLDIDGLRDLLAGKLGDKIHLVYDYGKERREELDFSSPFAFLEMLSKKPKPAMGPAVALVYVEGMIVQGEEEGGFLSSKGATDGSIRQAMRVALRDPDIKAVVVRIDSPGGSATASEAAWQAIRRVAAEKPVIISVGSMAASGGYYIASAGERIFADPAAVVGSIGVVGGKLSLGGLYDKLGITTQTFSRGANAGLFSSSTPFSDNQKVLMRQMMTQTYRQFQDRVLATRKGRIVDIEAVAQGRIFVGQRAMELGLIDELGGMDKALAYAASKGGLGKSYGVRVLPPPRTLSDILAGDEHARLPAGQSGPVSVSSQLLLLPEPVQQTVIMQLLMARELEKRPVMVVSPILIRVK